MFREASSVTRRTHDPTPNVIANWLRSESSLNGALNHCWAGTPFRKALLHDGGISVLSPVCCPDVRLLQRLSERSVCVSQGRQGKRTHHQCPTLLVPGVGQPLNLPARGFEWNYVLIIWYSLVEIDSFMPTERQFILLKAVPDVNGDVQYLEPWVSSVSGKTTGSTLIRT